MAAKKEPKQIWPAECCGVCSFWHMTDDKEQLGPCFALPPQIVNDGDDVIGVRPILEPNEPACILFRPKHHG
jgi:hypothetical protein